MDSTLLCLTQSVPTMLSLVGIYFDDVESKWILRQGNANGWINKFI